MTLANLEKRISITRSKGKLSKVSMPYSVYRQIRRELISKEIFEAHDTQERLQKAAEDIKFGRVKKYSNVDSLVSSLRNNE